jgi:hypothetical protein
MAGFPLLACAQVAFKAGQTIVKEGDVESKFYLMRAGTAAVHSRGGSRGGGGAASSSSNAAAPEPSGAPPPMGPPMGLSLDGGAAVCVEPMELDLSHLGALVL